MGFCSPAQSTIKKVFGNFVGQINPEHSSGFFLIRASTRFFLYKNKLSKNTQAESKILSKCMGKIKNNPRLSQNLLVLIKKNV